MKEGNDKGARSESCQRLSGIVNEVNINRGAELKTANAEGKEKETEPKKLQGKLNLAMKKICGGKLKVEVEGENGKVANRPKAPMTKPKRRKWKMQAR